MTPTTRFSLDPPRGFQRVFLVLSVLLGLFVFVTVFMPIIGEHRWRQSDTYSITRNLHTVSSDPLRPRLDFNQGRSGIQGSEAPVYPYLSSLTMYLFGENPTAARFVSFALVVAGIASLYLALRSLRGSIAGVSFVLACALSPLFLFESRQIQPDAPMAGLLMLAGASFLRFSQHERRRDFAAGTILFCLAVLAKSPAILAGPAMWLFSLAAKPAGFRKAFYRALWFAIPLGVVAAWQVWANHLNTAYNAGNAYVAISFDWNEVKQDIRDLARLRYIFESLLPAYVVNWVVFPAVAAGAVLSFRREERRLALPFWAWLLFGLVLCVLFARRFWSHGYYAALVAPPLCYFAGLGVAYLLRFAQRLRDAAPTDWAARAGVFLLLALFAAAPFLPGAWGTGTKAIGAAGTIEGRTWLGGRGLAIAGILAGVAVVAGFLVRKIPRNAYRVALALAGATALTCALYGELHVFSFRARLSEWSHFERDYGPLRRAIDCYSSPGELFVTNGGGDPWYLHLAVRRGFSESSGVISRNGVEFYRRLGVRYLVSYKKFGAPALVRGTRPLASGPLWELYCVSGGACERRRSCSG